MMLLTDDISLGEQHNFMAGYLPTVLAVAAVTKKNE